MQVATVAKVWGKCQGRSHQFGATTKNFVSHTLRSCRTLYRLVKTGPGRQFCLRFRPLSPIFEAAFRKL